MAINKMLMAYNKQEKEKLLLRVFVNRLMIFIYKLLLSRQIIEGTKPSIEHKIHWIDNDYFM
jgi:hypothetical protein